MNLIEKKVLTIEASDSFRKAYEKLLPLLQERVDRTVKKLAVTPHLPGLHIKKNSRCK